MLSQEVVFIYCFQRIYTVICSADQLRSKLFEIRNGRKLARSKIGHLEIKKDTGINIRTRRKLLKEITNYSI